MKSTLVLFFLALSLVSILAISVSFDSDCSFVAKYSNGTTRLYHLDEVTLNENGSCDVYFDYGTLVIEWPNGRNITYWKAVPEDHTGNEESCNIGCDGYSCSGHSINSGGCECGCTYCCYNSDKGYYYLCPQDSAACCHDSSYDTYGCAISVGCNICDS